LWTSFSAFRRRRVRIALAMVCTLGVASAAFVATSGPAIADVGSDRAQIAQLEKKIEADGARAEALVERANAVQANINNLDVQIARDHARLAADQRVERAALVDARKVAVQAYMSGGGTSTAFAVFSDASSVTKVMEQNSYLSAANSKLDAQLNTLIQDQARTRATQSVLRGEQARAAASLRDLSKAQHAATAAIASDEALLRNVKGNLRSLLAAQAAREAAADAARERALAKATQTPAPTPVPPPSTPISTPPPPQGPPTSPGAYGNPLRAISSLNPERIDQGVDFSGFGPIYAIGNGVVLSTVNGGWPGGTFIAYRLTDGPAAGLVVFAAEDIQPMVQIGQSVSANTVIGQVYEGPTGIETGWAAQSANGDTMARTYGQYHGGNSTAFGYNFSRLLQALGAPGGVLQNNPPTGSVPAGWPNW
jgi:murein DD-endopeptidase MepM/ murein hydrolase activator NlpD